MVVFLKTPTGGAGRRCDALTSRAAAGPVAPPATYVDPATHEVLLFGAVPPGITQRPGADPPLRAPEHRAAGDPAPRLRLRRAAPRGCARPDRGRSRRARRAAPALRHPSLRGASMKRTAAAVIAVVTTGGAAAAALATSQAPKPPTRPANVQTAACTYKPLTPTVSTKTPSEPLLNALGTLKRPAQPEDRAPDAVIERAGPMDGLMLDSARRLGEGTWLLPSRTSCASSRCPPAAPGNSPPPSGARSARARRTPESAVRSRASRSSRASRRWPGRRGRWTRSRAATRTPRTAAPGRCTTRSASAASSPTGSPRSR